MGKFYDYPLELRISRATIMKGKMILEQIQNNRNSNKWLQYTNSTRTRFNFATWLVHSFYSNRLLTPGVMATEMGVSRKSIDEIASDWLAENWLIKEKGTGIHIHKVFFHPSDEVLEINDEWFQWYEETIMPMVAEAYDLWKSSLVNRKDLQYDSQFNTTTGSNLSGIEDNVASFILNTKEKQRSKRNTATT